MPRLHRPVRRFRFSGFELDEQAGELRRDGERIHLTPQIWRILCLLVSRAGELVSREELQEALWREATLVDSEVGLHHCMNRLRVALGDAPEAPRFVLTVPRRGYRFIAPVERCGDPGGPALAVLPFEGLGRETVAESLADALTGAVITRLAGDSGLRVLSRQSVLHLKHTARSLAEIGAELAVDVVVEGTVSGGDDAVRVEVGLLQIEPEGHLWVGRFDGRQDGLLDFQERVAAGTSAGVREALERAGWGDRS